MSMSNYLEEQILNYLLRTQATFLGGSKPATIAIALCTSAPSDSDDGSSIAEVANSFSYARQTLDPADANWTDPSAGTQGESDNASTVTFGPASGGNWGTITHVAILDSSTHGAGNMFFYGSLSTSKTINDGDTFLFNIGDLNIQMN